MKILVKIFLIILFTLYFGYILFPEPSFPSPPSDSVQSEELADTETPLRRAYFTDFSREEVIAHYKNLFMLPAPFANIIMRLNYPPEESQTLIRDQTRSTFLEELAHPFRESLFINGFEPKEAKDDIWYKGRHFRQKIIIRYATSNVWARVGVGVLTAVSVVLLISQFSDILRKKKA